MQARKEGKTARFRVNSAQLEASCVVAVTPELLEKVHLPAVSLLQEFQQVNVTSQTSRIPADELHWNEGDRLSCTVTLQVPRSIMSQVQLVSELSEVACAEHPLELGPKAHPMTALLVLACATDTLKFEQQLKTFSTKRAAELFQVRLRCERVFDGRLPSQTDCHCDVHAMYSAVLAQLEVLACSCGASMLDSVHHFADV